jgi:hypothetical protein
MRDQGGDVGIVFDNEGAGHGVNLQPQDDRAIRELT